jgi:uncharacterized delta-60 repeat protein
VLVRATDVAGSITDQTLAVIVRNLNETPVAQNVAGTAEEDGQAITLAPVFADPDAQDTHTVTLDTTGTVGVVTLAGQSFSYDPAGRFESLAQGATAMDTFSYTVTDAGGLSSTRTATVTVVGSNDAASIDGMWTSVQEDVNVQNGALAASGALTILDPDTGENLVVAQTNVQPLPQFGHGWGFFSVTASGAWTYTVDNSLTQSLGLGQSDTEWLEVKSVDGTATEYVAVTIYGRNDAPVITGGLATGTVTEAGVLDDGTLSLGANIAQGTLTAADVDVGASLTWSGAATGIYGAFSINSTSGTWTYTLDNTAAATQALAEGQAATETFTASVRDEWGATTQQQVTVTVHGANDFVGVSAASELAGMVYEPQVVSSTLVLPLFIDHATVDAADRILFVGRSLDNVPVLGRLNPDGTPDTTYGIGGVSDLSDMPYAHAQIKPDPSGAVLVVLDGAVLRFDASGNRDLQFGINGRFDVPPMDEGTSVSVVSIAGIDANGSITLIVSERASFPFISDPIISAVRVSADGMLDTSFGDQGHLPFPGGPNGFVTNVVTDVQGRFIVAVATPEPEFHTELHRYLADGTIDPNFGDAGSAVVGYGINSILRAENSLLVSWTENTADPGAFAVHLVRLLDSGQRDSSFGVGGEVVLPFTVQTAVVEVDPQGRILVAFNTPHAYEDFNLARFNHDGSIDDSFGSAGLATASFGGSDYVTGIALRPDGGVVLTGWTLNAQQADLASFDGSGQPDACFVTDAPDSVTATGQLVVAGPDPDSGDQLQWSGSANGVYGQFDLDPLGEWTYLLDLANPATQALAEGQLAYETFIATLTDSYGATATQEVVITIVGSYDPPAL